MLSEKGVVTIQRTIPGDDEQYVPTFFQALGDMTRLRIVHILANNKGGDLCVTDIARILDCSLPATSQHMRILEHANIVEKKRHGRMACYQINFSRPFVKNIISLIIK